MIVGDARRLECAYCLVVAARYESLQAALRALEVSMGELFTILHRIEWDGDTRLFSIRDGRLHLTRDGQARVRAWGDALRALGISV